MFGYNFSTTASSSWSSPCCFFGPKRLPELGESIGKAIKGFKKAHDDPDAVFNTKSEIPGGTASQTFTTCPQCHKEITGEFAFCPHCGNKVTKA